MVNLPGKPSNNSLLWLSAWRYAVQHRWQTLLNITAIMIGVMMVVAVDLANNSAKLSFTQSIEIINGSITHQVVAGSDGVPDEIFARLKTELGTRRAAPGLSGRVMADGQEMTLLGIDAISEINMARQRSALPDDILGINGNLVSLVGTSNAVAMEESTASSLGLKVGESFHLSSPSDNFQVFLAATYSIPETETAGAIILADIAAAQGVLGRLGKIDSIDLAISDEEARQIRNWLPDSLTLVSAQSRTKNVEQMSNAFHTNLLAMSLLSLLVAGLLIYNTVTLSVVQRQQTLAIFRSQGVTGRELFILVILENAFTGLIASALGVITGYMLGTYLVTLVTGTVDALYFDLSVTGFMVSQWVLFKGLLLGLVLSLSSAAIPAWHASTSKPVTLNLQAARSSDWYRTVPRLALLGGAITGIGWLMVTPEHGSLVSGFIGLTLIVFGFCLAVPLFLSLLLRVFQVVGVGVLGLSGMLALRNVQSALNRTSLAVAALCVAVSVTVGVGVMIGSFRGTVILWLEQSLPGDIQLVAVSGPSLSNGLPRSLLEEITALDDVEALHQSVLEQVETEYGPVLMGVNDISGAEKFLMKELGESGYEAFDRGDGIFISEPLAYLNDIGINDKVSVLTGSGTVEFTVLGIFYDYTSGTGMIHMHTSSFQSYWKDEPVSRVTLDARQDINIESLKETLEILTSAYEGNFNVIANTELRSFTLEIFDRTFAITGVLRMLAILVAFVGVVSTLMALQLEKAREFAILRATGMTRRQTSMLIVKQTAILGFCSGLLALPLGLLMSDILIDVINRRSFGWTMQHFLPESVLLEAMLLAVWAALLAGIYPAWKSGHIKPALALRDE